jgi:hypothetical protein
MDLLLKARVFATPINFLPSDQGLEPTISVDIHEGLHSCKLQLTSCIALC